MNYFINILLCYFIFFSLLNYNYSFTCTKKGYFCSEDLSQVIDCDQPTYSSKIIEIKRQNCANKCFKDDSFSRCNINSCSVSGFKQFCATNHSIGLCSLGYDTNNFPNYYPKQIVCKNGCKVLSDGAVTGKCIVYDLTYYIEQTIYYIINNPLGAIGIFIIFVFLFLCSCSCCLFCCCFILCFNPSYCCLGWNIINFKDKLTHLSMACFTCPHSICLNGITTIFIIFVIIISLITNFCDFGILLVLLIEGFDKVTKQPVVVWYSFHIYVLMIAQIFVFFCGIYHALPDFLISMSVFLDHFDKFSSEIDQITKRTTTYRYSDGTEEKFTSTQSSSEQSRFGDLVFMFSGLPIIYPIFSCCCFIFINFFGIVPLYISIRLIINLVGSKL